jgi:hypothetical protein
LTFNGLSKNYTDSERLNNREDKGLFRGGTGRSNPPGIRNAYLSQKIKKLAQHIDSYGFISYWTAAGLGDESAGG